MPPLDMDLTDLDAELGEAGAQASRSLYGRTQPTRVFSNQLRARMLAAYAATGAASGAATASAGVGGAAALPRGAHHHSRNRAELETPGEAWAPMPLEPRMARRAQAGRPRARWSLLAAAALTGVVAVGALGARFDWLVPSPTAEPTGPVATLAAEPDTRPRPSAVAVLPVESAGPVAPTEAPEATPTMKPAATSPAPTKKPQATPTAKPKPIPTAKPDPTAPPIGPMDLMAKACPGGVVLDWTKPSTAVNHYHVLRSLDGDVPPTYPADGTTEIESATTWSAGTTDGFDASIGGGKTATYRAFAFDAEDGVMAASPSRTVTTVDAIELGSLGFVDNGDGSVTVTWAAAAVHAACFTYGKLVASVENPDPSYVKGSPYLAAISDPSVTGVTLEGLESGKTVWMRYELIRVTSTGKFVVGSTDVLQVTFP